jgi:orotate phosphoribosyltransferase
MNSKMIFNMDHLRDIKRRLSNLIRKKAFIKRKVKLSSGKISNYYFDLRRITLSSEGSFLVSELILDFIKKKGFSCVGGPTIGADPIVCAVVLLSYLKDIPLKAFIVRKIAKTHGLMRQIEGPQVSKKDKVLLVDDVATTGSSILETAEVLRKKGIKVDSAIVILDRQEGARKNLKKAKIKLYSLFKTDDFK